MFAKNFHKLQNKRKKIESKKELLKKVRRPNMFEGGGGYCSYIRKCSQNVDVECRTYVDAWITKMLAKCRMIV
jgi:hypothetical protein